MIKYKFYNSSYYSCFIAIMDSVCTYIYIPIHDAYLVGGSVSESLISTALVYDLTFLAIDPTFSDMVHLLFLLVSIEKEILK